MLDDAEDDDGEEEEDWLKSDTEKDADDDEPLKSEKKSKNGSELWDSRAEDCGESSGATTIACEDEDSV